MRIGITLPQFQDDPERCVEVARRAEAAGIDGVFVFDHLWPIGRPDRPALHGMSLLAALATETRRLVLGTMVARVSLLPDDVLVNAFSTVRAVAGDRVTAGMGTGDRLSEEENRAYGVAFPPAAERRGSLANCCGHLRALGVETWVGGLSPATRALGRAQADALNLWAVDPREIAEEVVRSAPVPVTWGGRVDLGEEAVLLPLLRSLAEAGAAWAVVAPINAEWPAAIDAIAETGRSLAGEGPLLD